MLSIRSLSVYTLLRRCRAVSKPGSVPRPLPWLRPLHCSSVCERGGNQSRPTRRSVKKVLDPDTLEELPMVRTGLEVNEQALRVAAQAEDRTGAPWKRPTSGLIVDDDDDGDNFSHGRKDTTTKKKRTSRREDAASTNWDDDVEEDAVTEMTTIDPDDKLPEGMSFSDLPRFKRIHGWDKENKHLRRLRASLSHADKSDDTVVLEGRRVIVDAMRAGHYPNTFIFSRINLLQGFPFDLSKDLAMYQVPYRNIKAWSELKTHPGFMASFSKSAIENSVASLGPASDSLPITLLLDNVRSPDNVGALARAAAAAGVRRVVCSRGCADVWSPKAIRAAAGAHFRVPIDAGVSWDRIHRHVPDKPQVVLADISRADDTSESGDMSAAEASRRLSALEGRCVEFRHSDDVEVHRGGLRDEDAAGLEDEDDALDMLERKKAEADSAVRGSGDYRDFSYYEMDILEEYCEIPLASVDYRGLGGDVDGREVVVVIGGETHGLSAAAKKFAHSHLGTRAFVPTKNGIDSLNVASAASVILFEIATAMERRK